MEGDSKGREKGKKGKEIIATGANGIVKWFDPALGYGFITRSVTTDTTRSDTTVFFHYSAIVENSEHATPLQQGQAVNFDVTAAKKGDKAVNVRRQGQLILGTAHSAGQVPLASELRRQEGKRKQDQKRKEEEANRRRKLEEPNQRKEEKRAAYKEAKRRLKEAEPNLNKKEVVELLRKQKAQKKEKAKEAREKSKQATPLQGGARGGRGRAAGGSSRGGRGRNNRGDDVNQLANDIMTTMGFDYRVDKRTKGH